MTKQIGLPEFKVLVLLIKRFQRFKVVLPSDPKEAIYERNRHLYGFISIHCLVSVLWISLLSSVDKGELLDMLASMNNKMVNCFVL